MPKRVKIAVVGDAAGDITDLLARKGLDPQQVDETQADQVVDEQDIVIYDARGSETVGNLCQRLRRSSRLRTLVVTSSYEAAEQILDAGYDDVTVAPYDPRELWLRVRKLLRATGRTAMRVGTLLINPAARQVRRRSENLELTRLEFDLLHYLIENAGRAVDYNELLTHVWECGYSNGS